MSDMSHHRVAGGHKQRKDLSNPNFLFDLDPIRWNPVDTGAG